MLWIGKIVGILLGYAFAGPLGAVIGFIFGHNFDIALRQQWVNSHPNSQKQSQVQNAFFIATFQVMGHVAKSDGRVSEVEIQAARAVMQRMGLNEKMRRRAIELFNQGKETDFSLQQSLQRLLENSQRNRSLLQMFYDIQLQAAFAEGVLSPQKKRLLQFICQRLGCTPVDFSTYESIYRGYYYYQQQTSQQRGRQQYYQNRQSHTQPSPVSTLSNAYKILGVPESATTIEIKRAYRKLMSQNHPDKLVAKGLPDEMMKLATEKTQQIRGAYDQIRESRGF
jgi:DnaJ like chaperone protein